MRLGIVEPSDFRVGAAAVDKICLGEIEVWSSAFNPLSLAPALWLDASDSTTLYDATTGGSLVAEDGAVARWEDKSGNARHATQATSGNRPLRKTSVQNSLDVLRFDGTDFMVTGSFGGSQAFERFVVCNDRSSPSQVRIIVAHATGFDSPAPGANYLLNTGRVAESSQNGSTGVGSLSQRRTGQVFTAEIFTLVGQRSDGTHAGHLIRINGTSPSLTSPFSANPGTFTKASSAFGVGAYPTGSLPLIGDIAEIIEIPRVLSDDERTALETYLMTKWGL